MSARHVLALALAALAIVVAAPATAQAAPYTVSACTAANPGNRLFDVERGRTVTCGAHLAADLDGRATWLDGSVWVLYPPAATRVTGFAISHAAQWSGTGWGSEIGSTLPAGWLAGPCIAAFQCGGLPGPSGSSAWARSSRSGLSLENLRLVSWCTLPTGCPGGFVHSHWRDLQVTIDDTQLPTVEGGSGLWNAGGAWVSGNRPVGFGATDNTGVKRLRVELDGRAGWLADETYACDYGRARPCADRPWSTDIDTSTLADGQHALRVHMQDAADSWGSQERTINVDNHAPAAPDVSVDGGDAFRAAPDWTLRWTNPPGQHAPIVATHYRVCRADGGGCTTGRIAGGEPTARGSFGIAEPGDYRLRLWLEDAAGNADPSAPSNEVKLRFDNRLPGRAALRPPPRRWIGAAEALGHEQPIAMAAGATVPLSGIAGYAVTADGSIPGTTMNAQADASGNARVPAPPGGWPEGAVRVRARAISGTGSASAEIGETVLRFDRTAPATRAYGQGAASAWQPGPVTVTLTATDALAGMGAADDDRPVEEGGHLAYSLDGGATRRVRGDEAQVPVAGGGGHTISFRAYDAAGNASAGRVIAVNVGEPSDRLPSLVRGFSDSSLGGLTTFRAAETFAAACPDRATLTAVRDAHVDQAQPAEPSASSSAVTVRSAAGANARALVGFDLPPAHGCRVISAELRLYANGATAGRTLQAFRLGSSWDGEVTWETRPGVAGTPATAQAGPAGSTTSVDVTGQIAGVYRYGDNGLLIRDRDESATAPAVQSFGSREGGRPAELVVRFG